MSGGLIFWLVLLGIGAVIAVLEGAFFVKEWIEDFLEWREDRRSRRRGPGSGPSN